MSHHVLAAGQVAERLNISVSSVARLVQAGELVPSIVLPGVGRLFDAGHVEDVAAARAVAARHDWRVTPPPSSGPDEQEARRG